MSVLAAKMFPLLAPARLIPLRESDLIVVSQKLKPVIKKNQRVASTTNDISRHLRRSPFLKSGYSYVQ
jgi:hypothetical protein